MLGPIVLMGGLGVVIGALLVVASKAFYVYEDPKVAAITDILPGANCGGCGQPGCGANAEAIVNGEADVNSCVAAGEDVAIAIAEVMGVSMTDKEPEFADLNCYYSLDKADVDYAYAGISDCRAAVMLSGGMKTCRIGCLGLGTCVTACMFGALKIGDSGLPEVDQEKCTGCGACERICPKGIIRLTSVSRRIMREYTLNDCLTPCQRACPTGIDIREYIRLIKEGEYRRSLAVIKERNPFPTVISRICPATCEMNCRRLFQDESVAINHLKRFVCDHDMASGEHALAYKAPASDKKVAVVGGGVEGLSAAYFSARLGHDAVVYEATDSPGGLLRKAISRQRLKMDLLDWDIKGVEAMGVTINTRMTAGRDFSIFSLLEQGFDAVFTATGGWDSRLTREEADEVPLIIPGMFLLIDLLREETHDQVRGHLKTRAVIVGGQASILDAVRRLQADGVQEITVVMRTDVPAQTADDLRNLDAVLIPHSGVTGLFGTGERLTAVECMDLFSGRMSTIQTDTVILGSGRMPELVFSPLTPEKDDPVQSAPDSPFQRLDNPPADRWQAVELQKEPEKNLEQGLLSSYDVVSGYSAAVSAINAGRKAAAAIHHVVHRIPFPDKANLVTRYSVIQDVDQITGVDVLPRHIIRINSETYRADLEAYRGYTSEEAADEARRCLRCGLLCYERSAKTDI